METDINFKRFADFLEKMIEKYGQEVMEEILQQEDNINECQGSCEAKGTCRRA